MNPFEGVTPTRVRVADVMAPKADQVRKEYIHKPTVAQYAKMIERGREFGPILVVRPQTTDRKALAALKKLDPTLAKRPLIVVDGFHRLEAHKVTKRTHVLAVVADAPIDVARWYGAQANIGHGRQLRNADYRRLFRFFIDAKQHVAEDGTLLSYRDIANGLGGTKGHTTIRNWMHEEYPNIARQYGRVEGFEYRENGGLRNSQTIGETMHSTLENLKDLTREVACRDQADRERIAAEMERLAGLLRSMSGTTSGLVVPKKGSRKGLQLVAA